MNRIVISSKNSVESILSATHSIFFMFKNHTKSKEKWIDALTILFSLLSIGKKVLHKGVPLLPHIDFRFFHIWNYAENYGESNSKKKELHSQYNDRHYEAFFLIKFSKLIPCFLLFLHLPLFVQKVEAFFFFSFSINAFQFGFFWLSDFYKKEFGNRLFKISCLKPISSVPRFFWRVTKYSRCWGLFLYRP